MNYYLEYCTGCGLCQNCGYGKLIKRDDGFSYPVIEKDGFEEFCDRVCPMSKKMLNRHSGNNLWGEYLGFYKGYATNETIRYQAASGGILSALCYYLLEQKKVDWIICNKEDPADPIKNVTIMHNETTMVLSSCGSRYAESSPLKNIDRLLDENHTFAFIGKPCDIKALKAYSEEKPIIKHAIKYYLTFFCAGVPSDKANELLLEKMGLEKKKCKSLTYRGYGWPGQITAISDTGKRYSMDYEDAWMNILGRDIRKCCKFCIDGIGEDSDVAAGDFWNLDKCNKPDFQEHPGYNCVFSWNKTGEELLEDAHNLGYIEIIKENPDKLQFVQPNHFNKRVTAYYKILGMHLMLKKAPRYSSNRIKRYSKGITTKKAIICTFGTIRRAAQGKL